MIFIYTYLSLMRCCFPVKRDWKIKQEDIDSIRSPLKNVLEWNSRLLSVKVDIQLDWNTQPFVNTKSKIYCMELTKISKQLHYLLVEKKEIWASLIKEEEKGLTYRFMKKYNDYFSEMEKVCLDFEKLAGRIGLSFVEEAIMSHKLSLDNIFTIIKPEKHLENDIKLICDILKTNRKGRLVISY